MKKIYDHQTRLILEFKTDIDMTTISSAVVKYKDPTGSIGILPNTIVTDAPNGIVQYTNDNTPFFLNKAGCWLFYIEVTFTDGRILPTDNSELQVYKKWN